MHLILTNFISVGGFMQSILYVAISNAEQISVSLSFHLVNLDYLSFKLIIWPDTIIQFG